MTDVAAPLLAPVPALDEGYRGGSPPDVSVVVGAYNAMPYLTACLDSLAAQTIGLGRIEVIGVDDGSTDGSGKELERFADEHPGVVRVVHQENSGGPSGPRNVGLDLATGRYVFFLDADDRLGPEALERMVGLADAQGSDVVLGKMVGVDRGVPQSMFTHTQPRADLFSSRVWWTLSATKLFRRSHVQGLGLRFPTHYRIGEDQMFTSRAYFAARCISVVADYDCYYATGRDDGGNITATDTDLASRLRFLADMCALVADRVEAGPRRDFLLRRQFGIDLALWTGPALLRKEPGERYRLLELAREILRDWGSHGVLEPLNALLRLRFHLIGRGLFDEALEVVRFAADGAGEHGVVVEDGVVHARYPFFRDPAPAVPDACYDITRELRALHHLDRLEVEGTRVRLCGSAFLEHLGDAATTVEVLLRERRSRVEHRLPTQGPESSGAGFRADIDLATAAGGGPLPPGVWDVHLLVRTHGVERLVRLGSRRSAAVDAGVRTSIVGCRPAGPSVLTTYFTKPHSNLTLDVGETLHALEGFTGRPEVRWSADGDVLLIDGRLRVASVADGVVRVSVRDRTGQVLRFPAVVQGGTCRAAVPLAALAPGRWSVALSFALSSGSREFPVRRPRELPAARWRRNLRPCYARPVTTQDDLELEIAPVALAAGVRRRVRKAIRRR